MPGGGNYGINEAGVKEEIPIIDKVAAETAAGVIDMHAALAGHPEMLPDRVHPNTAGATVMARAAYKALTGKEPPPRFRPPRPSRAVVPSGGFTVLSSQPNYRPPDCCGAGVPRERYPP